MKFKDTALIKAEMQRVAHILDELEELQVPEYIENESYEIRNKRWDAESKQNSLKAELKNRLLMVRKDCLIIRNQVKEYCE